MGRGEPPARTSTLAITVKFIAKLIRWWALLGGLMISVLAILTTGSAVSLLLTGVPFSADYELAKYIVGIAIFTFLPYCQLSGSNVTVDIFTEGLGASKKAMMSMFSAIFAIVFSVLLLRQMYLGFLSYLRYPEVTPVLQLPLWTAFPAILLSLALLLAAALMTFYDAIRVARRKKPIVATYLGHPGE
jgi:TRAP-type C4-dicarboxylate transport system permease small subunit